MSDVIEHAVLIPDDEKLNLQAGDMFDRIINLKLTCVDVATKTVEVFVIRSDYELVFPSSTVPVDGAITPSMFGRYIIRRCTYKPSIKVQTKMVSSNTGVTTDIYINNFFLLTEDGKHLRSFNSSKYRIEKVEIAMGYWSQFRIGKELDIETSMSLEDYFNIDAKKGADKLTLTGTIVVTTDKLPPDSILHIKAFVADIYSSPVAVSELVSDGKVDEALKNPVASSGTGFKQILYDNITRRYINKERIQISGLKRGRKLQAISDIKDAEVSVSYDKSGLMATEDADKYGVRVYLSKEAEKVQIRKVKDSKGEEKDKILYFEAGWTMGHTIARIMSFVDTSLDFTFTNHGDMLIYTPEEGADPESLNKAFEAQGLYKDTVLAQSKLYNSKLPAVYNINVDAVATITCPFFTFIEPFQFVEFSSRYALTSMVSYFASYSPTVYRFLVISAQISFATVDDTNEVQLTAVSQQNGSES